jgi:hypothetical protein
VAPQFTARVSVWKNRRRKEKWLGDYPQITQIMQIQTLTEKYEALTAYLKSV